MSWAFPIILAAAIIGKSPRANRGGYRTLRRVLGMAMLPLEDGEVGKRETETAECFQKGICSHQKKYPFELPEQCCDTE